MLGGSQTTAAQLDDDTLRLVVPLTPSRNEIDRWYVKNNFKKLGQWKSAAHLGIVASLGTIWPGGALPRRPWADHIIVSIIRCTDTHRSFDPDNTQGGCKAAMDAIKNAELIKDDGEGRVTWRGVETRLAGQWGGLDGPATHLIIRRST